MNATSIREDILRSDVEQHLPSALQERLKFPSRHVDISVASFKTSPGRVIGEPTSLRDCIRGGPQIILQKSHDWEIKTCYFSGEHFFPPAPLGFFFEGDQTKPVAPHVAFQQGFTICDRNLFQAIVAILNDAESLLALPGWMATANAMDEGYLTNLNVRLEAPTFKWGGDIDDSYTLNAPGIEPANIEKAIADAAAKRADAILNKSGQS